MHRAVEGGRNSGVRLTLCIADATFVSPMQPVRAHAHARGVGAAQLSHLRAYKCQGDGIPVTRGPLVRPGMFRATALSQNTSENKRVRHNDLN